MHVVFSDIANGPWNDTENAEHSQFFKTFLERWPFNASVRSGKTNAFDLAGAVEEEVNPDLVVSFGSWRNILCDKVLNEAKCSTHAEFRPTKEDKYHIEKRQYAVFSSGQQFMSCMVSSVPVQVPRASFLVVAPSKYFSGVQSNRDRPEIMFKVPQEEAARSWYQGADKHTEYMALYVPKDGSVLPNITRNGTSSVADILLMHQKTLVISAGRCDFWAQVMKIARRKKLTRLCLLTGAFGAIVIAAVGKERRGMSVMSAMLCCLGLVGAKNNNTTDLSDNDDWGFEKAHSHHRSCYEKCIANCDRCSECRHLYGLCKRCLYKIKYFYGFKDDAPKVDKNKPTPSERVAACRLLSTIYLRLV